MRIRWLPVCIGAAAVIAACGPSTWEQHQALLSSHAEAGNWAAATDDAQWLIDKSLLQAPRDERSPEAEASRYLRLAQLAARAGKTRIAVDALRETVMRDPTQAENVRRSIEALSVSADELARIKHEFAWNMAALSTSDATLLQQERAAAQCWSYRVREVRLHKNRVRQVEGGSDRELTYDSRSWIFDVSARTWTVEGGWVEDAATEIERVGGPQQPRFRALSAAPHQFYAEAVVPPCHRSAWTGPFAPDGTVFVARHLPN